MPKQFAMYLQQEIMEHICIFSGFQYLPHQNMTTFSPWKTTRKSPGCILVDQHGSVMGDKFHQQRLYDVAHFNEKNYEMSSLHHQLENVGPTIRYNI